MVIPWVGFPLSEFIKRSSRRRRRSSSSSTRWPTPTQMPGVRQPVLRWPYIEGLRMDEAMHPLTILAVGLYGEVMPKQDGAPIRLIVPWKYGFKSAKSIVRIRFVEKQPLNTWQESQRRRNTASTRTSTRPSITRAGPRPPSAASASSSGGRR